MKTITSFLWGILLSLLFIIPNEARSENRLSLSYQSANGDENKSSTVVEAYALSVDLSDGQVITTMLGEDLEVMITADGVFINEVEVILANLEAGNGVVHVIDAVLLPGEDATNVVNLHEIQTTVYPNPANSFFNIESSEEINRIRIMDSLGRIVYEARLAGNNLTLNTNI